MVPTRRGTTKGVCAEVTALTEDGVWALRLVVNRKRPQTTVSWTRWNVGSKTVSGLDEMRIYLFRTRTVLTGRCKSDLPDWRHLSYAYDAVVKKICINWKQVLSDLTREGPIRLTIRIDSKN